MLVISLPNTEINRRWAYLCMGSKRCNIIIMIIRSYLDIITS